MFDNLSWNCKCPFQVGRLVNLAVPLPHLQRIKFPVDASLQHRCFKRSLSVKLLLKGFETRLSLLSMSPVMLSKTCLIPGMVIACHSPREKQLSSHVLQLSSPSSLPVIANFHVLRQQPLDPQLQPLPATERLLLVVNRSLAWSQMEQLHNVVAIFNFHSEI